METQVLLAWLEIVGYVGIGPKKEYKTLYVRCSFVLYFKFWVVVTCKELSVIYRL